ncbi:MAG: MFS transporter [Myxococcales bacterium]|nr:MFS transporter [Myxococcales bacterium]
MLTAWALWLELPPALIGLVGALPCAAQVVQLPAAWVSRRLGSRRHALWAVSLSRQAVLPMALIPWLPWPRAVFLGCVLTSAALGVAGNNGWTSWMGDLVPGRIRGRYFGRRSAVCALSACAGSLGVGLLLDKSNAAIALPALSAAACVAGLATTLLMRAQHDPGRALAAAPRLDDVLEPARDPLLRRVLAYQAAWSAAGGIAAAFYPVHMVANLRMTFVLLALYNGGIAAAKFVAAPLWGRLLDRRGEVPILIGCSFASSFSAALWLVATPSRLWPLAIDAALSGACMAGLSLASFSLPVALSRPKSRAFYVAAISSAGGLSAAIGSSFGGLFAHAVPAPLALFGRPLMTAHVLFLIGGVARLGASMLALRLRRPRPAEALAPELELRAA